MFYLSICQLFCLKLMILITTPMFYCGTKFYIIFISIMQDPNSLPVGLLRRIPDSMVHMEGGINWITFLWNILKSLRIYPNILGVDKQYLLPNHY